MMLFIPPAGLALIGVINFRDNLSSSWIRNGCQISVSEKVLCGGMGREREGSCVCSYMFIKLSVCVFCELCVCVCQ